MTGLLIAAVFAAAMSTISTSLNSSATLIMGREIYQRDVNPRASERQSMAVLYLGTIVWGLLGIGGAILFMQIQIRLGRLVVAGQFFLGRHPGPVPAGYNFTSGGEPSRRRRRNRRAADDRLDDPLDRRPLARVAGDAPQPLR